MSLATHAPCPEDGRKAFLREPVYVRLPAGEHLYKFVSIPIVRHYVLQSPWWIRGHSFDDLRTRARRLHRPVADLVRSQMAIAYEWNPGMDNVFIVVLGSAVDAWEGPARPQHMSTQHRTAAFIGGGCQLYIPNLNWHDIAGDYIGTYTG